jgi:hypothetical protein
MYLKVDLIFNIILNQRLELGAAVDGTQFQISEQQK